LKDILFQRNSLLYTYDAKCSNVPAPNAIYDLFLGIAKKPLIDIYNMYKNGDYKVPVKLKVIAENNYGI
jgi:hypothetical protein